MPGCHQGAGHIYKEVSALETECLQKRGMARSMGALRATNPACCRYGIMYPLLALACSEPRDAAVRCSKGDTTCITQDVHTRPTMTPQTAGKPASV
jgi:hypothetical protein